MNRAKTIVTVVKFLLKHFGILMKVGWILQWAFMLFGAISLWLGWYWFGFFGLVGSFGMHLLTVVYKGYLIEYLQKMVSADPFLGLPGRRKRNLKRKIQRRNGVS